MADILNSDLEYFQDVADRYDKRKRKFEAKLERRIKRLFREISKDFVPVYSLTGSSQDMEIYRSELEGILTLSYRETGSYFSKHFERELQKVDSEEAERLLIIWFLASPLISARVLSFNRQQVRQHAGFILDTTRNVLIKNTEKATIILAEANPTVAEIAKEAGKLSAIENANRAGSISESEIGNSASGSRGIEDNIYGEELRKSNVNLVIIGNWIAQLDEVTRKTHLEVHGDKRPTGVPFQVGSDQMLRPFDASLGASLANILGCRCNLVSGFGKNSF